ncbi:hypothetical protein MRB53_016503 [Persea americana]|uniref:Uncharacterized protein n=1 Tax=Persea americana TaxID=3435 RepID=A0ACC2M3B6_PERAE|nr:hypothetical protein MRB53_016503 [Persea americana]
MDLGVVTCWVPWITSVRSWGLRQMSCLLVIGVMHHLTIFLMVRDVMTQGGGEIEESTELGMNKEQGVVRDIQSHGDPPRNEPGKTIQASVVDSETPEEQLGRGHRTKLPSSKLRDYVTNTIKSVKPPACSSQQSSSSGTPYPIAHYVNCDKFSLRHRIFLAVVAAGRSG